MKTKRRSEEYREQKSLVNYLRLNGVMVAAIPNGGGRDIRTAVHLKAMGLLAGMPDLIVLGQPRVDRLYRLPVLIEMKDRGERPSSAQREVHAQLQALGYPVIVAFSWHQAAEELVKLGYRLPMP